MLDNNKFNTEPYYDDFNEDKKFYKILFRPSMAVQARELTQLQTLIQNQVKRHGDHIFTQGAMVIPGQMSIDSKADYVKLEATYGGVVTETFLENLKGKRIIGTSGVAAEIVEIAHAEQLDNSTIYVRYVTSGTDNVTKKFSDGEILTTEDELYNVQAISSGSTGVGSIASIQRGIYYVNGYFVLCDTQSILLEKYSNTPTYRIGLNIVESIVTESDDETILDNAQNSYNYAAPGAHRYAIDLVLSKRALTDTNDTDFIELSRVDEGTIKRQVNTTDYAILEQTMARRTFDESGNYTVTAFEIDVREHRNNNRGAWTTSTSYLAGDVVTSSGKKYYAKNSATSGPTAPTHTSGSAYDNSGTTGVQWEYSEAPYYNRGVYLNGDENKLAIGLEPGKAYVQGYEIEKIATEYVEVDKARTFAQTDGALIPSSIGNYVLVTNLKKLPDISSFETVKIYDRTTTGGAPSGATLLGTARVKAVEWDSGTVNSSNGIYKLFLFDVKLNSGVDFNTKVKSFVGDSTTFSANINPITTSLIGSVSQTGINVTGTGTSFQTDLVVGDYVYLDTNLVRVVSISSQQAMTVDASHSLTGVPLSRVSTEIKNPESSSLIFPLPYYAIKSLRSSINTNDTTYSIYEIFTGFSVSNTGQLTVTTTSGVFASPDENDNFIITVNSSGEVLNPTSAIRTGSSITFTIPSISSTTPVTVIGAVVRTGSSGTEKTKTLTSSVLTLTTEQSVKSGTISLGKADCYRVVSVVMQGGSFSSPSGTYSIDITDRFEFDDGQRDTHYDIGTLKLKSSFAPPSAPIKITFEYFTHSAGDYFSVNSYSSIPYGNIPSYRGYPLRDCIDFRPRINDNGLTFSSSGGAHIPKRGTDIISDFSYYLSRTDKIAIDFNGKFFTITGVNSLNPGVPEDAKLSMTLYTLEIEPYTFGTTNNNVKVTKVDNRRYTMRDIGKLEQRINTLEYYTSLSLLEQETASLSIKDADNLDRFKNGFIVDNFTGHNVGDVGSPDYFCAIDMERGELRPFFSMSNVNLVEKNSNNIDRIASNYEITGDVITLPILEHLPLVKQEYASRTEFVNPYAIFTFLGDVRLTPSSDEWFDVDRRPDILKNEEGNFNIAYMMAEKSGVLGTVWNAWETQWTGTPVATNDPKKTYEARREGAWPKAAKGAIQISVAEADKRFGKLAGNAASRAMRRIVTETVATQVGKSRTGTKTSIVAKIDTRVVEDRTLSTVMIPYIRSRNILVQIKKLKPNTRFYGYFDNTPISEFCTPASKIEYTITSGVFMDDTNVGGLGTEEARRVNGDTQSCLTRGDVVTGSTSGATAVIVGKEFNPNTNKTSLFVSNVKGTFVSGETITGNVSTATGVITALEINTVGSPLVTNFSGDINLLFNIPNTDSIRFRTGIRELKLIDSDVATGQFSSRARVNYSAQGVLETKQATVLSTRNAQLVEEQLVENQVIVQTSERVVSDTGWYDPLAQTFLVESTGGAFLTKVDLFFASKDPNVPVSIEIREVVNGYPGKRILPFSKVTKQASEVNLSTTTVIDFEGVEYPDFNTPTTFVFSSPVYVQNNGEYALVVQSDSNAYKIWISQMGDLIPGSTRTISEQPYNGVMFKSQNASTWTADQNQDMKFTIYRAKFDISAAADVEFVNDVLPLDVLDLDPFETIEGGTKVRVWHRNHGMPDGSYVVFVNANEEDVNGIPANEIYDQHIIDNVTDDSYTITVSTAASVSGYAGGSTVRATKNVQYDIIQPVVQAQSFSDTSISYAIKTISGKSVNGTQSPYDIGATFESVLANENNSFYAPRMVASEVNEDLKIGGNKSLTLAVQMLSNNDALSPVIDTHRTSAIVVSNKINYPTEVNTNVSELDTTSLFTGATGAFSFLGSTITTTNASVLAWFDSIIVGNYITVENATTSSNNGTFLVTQVSNDGTTGVITISGKTFTTEAAATATELFVRKAFFDEITPVGSSTISKYTSKTINLATPSTFLRIRLAANIPAEAEVLVYYKTSPAGSVSDLSSINWVLSSPDSNIVKVENGSDEFFDIDYSEDGLVPFDAVAVKLVMRSTNSSAVPRIKDLRIIACA